jgi:Ni2+-binding GTPase involved in maturation of urease and hydrogenase
MSGTIRFVMVGGFLGAGKTTTIARLARMYQDRGLRVGIVTNDQATDLVDTNTLISQGFAVGEVAGACFCCNFDELTRTVEQLEADARPDVVLAEPVGSCTDLVATVVQPLRQLYGARFDVAPYAVILKPSHGRKILKNQPGAGFSPKAAYIFRKQLEEADGILINRLDELSQEQVEELADLIHTEHPGVPLLRISARTGTGFAALADFLDQRGQFGMRILDLDYDIYAEGEAELGWLNSSLSFAGPDPFSLDALLMEIITRLRDSLASERAETAHLKTIGLWQGFYGVANLVSSESDPELSLPSNCHPQAVELIVNARVAIDPQLLETHVRRVIDEISSARKARVQFRQTQSFRPGRPVPTHRFATAL